MKRVESFVGIDGIQRTWNELETQYYNDIINGINGYISPLERLNLLYAEGFGPQEVEIINYLIANFEDVVKANPEEIEVLIELFNNNDWSNLIHNHFTNEQTNFGKRLYWAFRYEKIRERRLVRLASKMNIKSCLYCNAQYTIVLTSNNRQLAIFQFDHFFPKSRYPYLSISLYNLLPVCASCNQHKSNIHNTLAELVHPYLEDFHILTAFTIPVREQIRMLFGDVVREDEFEIQLTNVTNLKVQKYEDKFALSGIYNRHKDIVIEIFRKAYAYRHGGKEALMDLRNHDGKQLFASEDEIEWLLLANYKQSSDINKRPLAKFMQDIAKQAGLIR
ncbi:MAG: hypothetical protein M9926_06055 [Lentimicrobium sp.]|uniref:HNH endonuclease domain-containing protein n=1 Tax=Lentimicrobium sp. TaxID=2034841 RepID=UPI0025F22457|nr:HNH endonuclease domain-containing protein [Lentimicrobium sp.]MCO5256308.1 hypothetical protein [Lentimicrobium sp.]